jgi:ribosome-associated toxin RatA of RatAB toxin-antitoxin module
MNRSNKIIIIFYVGLAISLISILSWVDSSYDRSDVDLEFSTDPIKNISFENMITRITHEQMFDVLTDVKNYPKVLPKNILSVEILDTTDNSITAIEEISENFIKTKLLVKHSFIPMEKHVIEILDGDAKGTIITQHFEKISTGFKIKTNVEFDVKGILSPVTFLPKSNLESALNTVIEEFIVYAELKTILSENEFGIDSVYREILLRPADSNGMEYYMKMMQAGKMTIDDVREVLINSEEYETLILLKEFTGIDSIKPETRKAINELYLEILQRPADQDGLIYFSIMFDTDRLSLDDIRNKLLMSEEKAQINFLDTSK